MGRKLNCIMLVDDDIPTNFIHERIISEANYANNVVVARGGNKALDYLRLADSEGKINPDLILLDINMPAMDGWEFLEAYEEQNFKSGGRAVIVILTTSLNPLDKEKARGQRNIKGFISKPLSEEKLNEIYNRYFLKN